MSGKSLRKLLKTKRNNPIRVITYKPCSESLKDVKDTEFIAKVNKMVPASSQSILRQSTSSNVKYRHAVRDPTGRNMIRSVEV